MVTRILCTSLLRSCSPCLAVLGKQGRLVVDRAESGPGQRSLTLHQACQHLQVAVAKVPTVPDPVVVSQRRLNVGKLGGRRQR